MRRLTRSRRLGRRPGNMMTNCLTVNPSTLTNNRAHSTSNNGPHTCSTNNSTHLPNPVLTHDMRSGPGTVLRHTTGHIVHPIPWAQIRAILLLAPSGSIVIHNRAVHPLLFVDIHPANRPVLLLTSHHITIGKSMPPLSLASFQVSNFHDVAPLEPPARTHPDQARVERFLHQIIRWGHRMTV